MNPKGNPNISKNPQTWRKGKSGNPGGRPPGLISDCLRKIGNQKSVKGEIILTDVEGKAEKLVVDIQAGKGQNINFLAAAVVVEKALRGDMKAFTEWVNRVEGAPKQIVDMNSEAGFRLEIGAARLPAGSSADDADAEG